MNYLNFTSTKAVVNDSPMQVCPQPKIRKPKVSGLRVGLLPKRPMKNSSENEKTKIVQKFCPVKQAQEHLKCNRQERQNKLEQNSNHQSVKVSSGNRILSLNSVANSCKRKVVQTKINAMGVTENKHFSYIHSSIPRVREEIGDANILKFDEELETPKSAIVENYLHVVPKKIKICSTITRPSRHKRTSKIETENFSGWTTEKEKSSNS